jgi:hypothetical protein
LRCVDHNLPAVEVAISRLSMKSLGLAGICRNMRIVANHDIQTARVCISRRKIWMEISPNFWRRISESDRVFVLAHEAFHIAMGHIERGKEYAQELMNIAADAITNGFLIDEMNFDVSDALQDQVITIESLNLDMYRSETMEEVMSLITYPLALKTIRICQWVSEHASATKEDAHKAISDLFSHLDSTEKADIGWSNYALAAREREMNRVGVHAAQAILRMVVRGKHGLRTSQHYTWTQEPRRMCEGLLLPSLEETSSLNGCLVRFYLDCSGSMYGLEDMMAGCVRTMEAHDVEVSQYWFDTQVHQTDKSSILSGGGTDFKCIAEHASIHPNFDLSVVITDGYAAQVSIPNHRKWLWLITEGGSSHAVRTMCWKPFSWAFQAKLA